MSFEEIFTKSAVLAKELEVRWFHSNNDSNNNDSSANTKTKQHNMPFLRRSLQYIDTKHQPIRSAHNSSYDNKHNVDLLYKFFKHRTLRFNEALLPNQRRATRTQKALDDKDNTNNINSNKRCTETTLINDGTAAAPNFKTENPPAVNLLELTTSSSSLAAYSLTKHLTKPTPPPSGSTLTTTASKKTVVFYHYFHTDEDNFPAVYFEIRNDHRCPFCFFHAGTEKALIMHCNNTHFDGFTFDGVKDENNNLHIAVRGIPPKPKTTSIEKNDFTYIRPKKNKKASKKSSAVVQEIPMVVRPIHRITKLDPITRKKRARMLEEQNAPTAVIAPYLPTDQFPSRQYYHSRTNLPMLEGDWDYDSDDEPDDTWYHRMGDELMEDFDDVSSKEKTFMKMWNKFIKVHTTTADKSIPAKCITFIQTHLSILVNSDLRQNLLLHLLNLWDSGLISSNCILSCMEIYDGGDVSGDDNNEDDDAKKCEDEHDDNDSSSGKEGAKNETNGVLRSKNGNMNHNPPKKMNHKKRARPHTMIKGSGVSPKRKRMST